MNKSVELLIKRMETHPEEFVDQYDYYHEREPSKWDGIINQLFHRAELMDKDSGVEVGERYVRAVRRSKPLSYLSDEEVQLLLDKLNETRAKHFEQHVMGILLKEPKPNEDGQSLYARSVTTVGTR